MSAAKEFMSMMIKFRSVSRFTLRHHKEFIQSKLDELGLKKYVPGVQSSPGWIQAQEQLKFIGAMTDEELDNPDLLRGLRVRRISWKLGKPEKEIKDFIYEYYRFSEMQRFVKYLHAAGLPEPKK
uniref:Signal recognition particle SRP54 subunit M-domain domain-containing protein n=1 Tax=Aureoumbra lagunensis TaxID=44058 RepID=A0A7S3K6V3_9STRA